MTEAEVLNMLRARHVRPGNGGSGEYAFLTHVRNAAGFAATNTIDAIAMNLWPSRGFHLHAFEVKCSRSDWLREMKKPEKAEAMAQLVDRFSLVVADPSIVKEGELPLTWGLLVVKGKRLECVKDAPVLPHADPKRPVSRSFLVSLLRAGGAVPQAEAAEITAARREGIAQGIEQAQRSGKDWRAMYDEQRQQIADFQRESGLTLGTWNGHDPAVIGAAIKSLLRGDDQATRAHERIARVQVELREAADSLDQFTAPLGPEVR